MMLKKMPLATAVVGVLALTAGPFVTSASAQGDATEPPKAPSPSEGGAMKGGAMKGGAMKGGAMKGGMMKKSKGGMMMKKSHGKKM